ncbi:Stk1 family PASTA domain-containing Ser/Thr kinase [Allokutzneria sp. A3M-2-11 16]|uniref:Stk1 family PASTA domain-containing Ser/Thr kinase n=1 Tax=Allokutzneria sp. A3M-2-11 16 TaxID=2962043 RepID=UPI0020B6BD1A|nr:Stk1 family PASTA domain-containing Ser/Thr kinase [Allokutzneria sp. A3M-2-11 16]MCP3799528.1 Stk1 family PASTA domain-containing Ser/Thr kinase [Allokutzneria sp. A3M-2-11 16]
MSTPRLLSNRYELGETLGYGGMSEVHKGKDVRLGRDVAIKVLRADLARDPQFQIRFRREAQNAASLNHPAIVAVYDTGETQTEHGPLPYIVMEFVDGKTLRDIVKTEGPLHGRRAMEVMADVCAALDFSHRHGIVHRDVKPANVMITRGGAVKVMDFGIARAVADGQAAVTQTAAVIGTAQYLSPEQARGEAVDARSDVYAAGCVLFELLTGEPPFTGDSPVAVAYQHVREEPKPPSSLNPQVPQVLDAIVLKAMSKNPANRYQSSGEMRGDLVRVLSGQRPMAPMVMSEDERTAMMGRGSSATEVLSSGRHRPSSLADDDDDDRDAKRKRATRIALLVGLFVAVLALTVWISSLMFGPQSADEVTIPSDLKAMAQGPAETKLRDLGLKPIIEQTSSSANELGKVVDSSPTPGSKVKKGSEVRLKIGSGPDRITVPSLLGKSSADAEKLLKEAGLVLNPTQDSQATEDSSQIDKVVKQTPEPGTFAAKGDSVKITLGKVQEKSSVVDVRGQDIATARKTLEDLKFVVDVKNESSAEDKDKVIDQSPRSGKLAQGTKITLTVSKGDQFKMPNLEGKKPSDAESLLRTTYGWTGTFKQTPVSPDNPWDLGKIQDQTPASGQSVSKTATIDVQVGTIGTSSSR